MKAATNKRINKLIADKIMGIKTSALYSTDISAAWQVVEKLEDEYDVRIWSPHRRLNAELSDTWECELTDKTTGAWWNANAETAAEAICLAALHVMGMEEEEE